MKKIFKPLFLFTCLAGSIAIGALRLRDIFNQFGFWPGVAVGLMGFGLFIVLGTIAVKQTLEISRRDP
jgi:hypothetical protein